MDMGVNKPLPIDTLLHIYSMTKPITNAAFMALYDEDICQLDDPVSKFLPFIMIRMMYGPNLLIDISAEN